MTFLLTCTDISVEKLVVAGWVGLMSIFEQQHVLRFFKEIKKHVFLKESFLMANDRCKTSALKIFWKLFDIVAEPFSSLASEFVLFTQSQYQWLATRTLKAYTDPLLVWTMCLGCFQLNFHPCGQKIAQGVCFFIDILNLFVSKYWSISRT